MQLTKKRYKRKKANKKEATHFEGKFFCDCKTRNIRKWLGVKMHGQPERLNPEDHIEDNLDMICDSLNSVEIQRGKSEEVSPPNSK